MNTLYRLAVATLEDCRRRERSMGWGGSSAAEITSVQLVDLHGRPGAANLIFGACPRSLILGPPGAGKSTLLRARAAAVAQAFLASRSTRVPSACAPLLISAARLHQYLLMTHSITQSLAQHCVHDLGIPMQDDDIARWLDEGSVELLVDGLDELGLDWNVTVAELNDLFRRLPKLRGVISSRPAALTVNFNHFAIYTIAELDPRQTRDIVNRLAADRPELVQPFLELLKRSARLAELARTPLLLSMMLKLFEGSGALPESRSTLFSTVTELLVRRETTRPFRKVNSRDVYQVLAVVAAKMFQKRQLTMSRTDFRYVVDDEIRQSSLEIDRISAHEFEEDILSSGLLQEVGDGLFSFSHKTFLEYFVAWFYRDDLSKLSQLFWHEDGESVLEFAGGMIENPAPLVEQAVAHGRLVLAARIASSRYNNPALLNYVTQAFRNALEPGFLALLVDAGGPRSMRGAGITTLLPTDASPAPVYAPPTVTFERMQGRAPDPAANVAKPSVFENLLALLDGVRNEALPNHERGKVFETFIAMLFGEVFKVVHQNYLTDRGEIDLVIELERGGLYWADFGNEALVECKNLRSKATLEQTAAFLTKLDQSRRRLGFIVSYLGFTPDALRALQLNASKRDAPLVIAITGEDIRKSLQLSENPAEFFKNAYRNVTLPRRGAM